MHPECTRGVLAEADYIGSTSGIINYVAKDSAKEYIIGTEIGVLYELIKQNPNKQFFTLRKSPVCADMKKITLEKVLNVLEKENNVVTVSKEISEKALLPLEKMLMLAK